MKYLFVTWDGGGNFHCVLPLAQRLVARGHEVRFLGHPGQRSAAEASGCSFVALRRAPDTAAASANPLLDDWHRSPRGTATLYRDKLLFGPASLYAADVLEEVERDRPDAIAVDFFLFGAIAAAERTGLPAAVLWHTVYAPPTVTVPPFASGWGVPRRLPGRLGQAAVRKLNRAWFARSTATFNASRAEIGLAPLREPYEQFNRAARVLVLSSSAFDFAALSGASLPANVRYVGAQTPLPQSPAADRQVSDDPPLVLVGFSTTYMGQQALLRRVIDALGQLPVRALVTTGPAVSVEGELPGNVEVTTWVDHADVLPHAALIVTHAGHGTVSKSLAHGVPVVCIPMGRDQPDVAARVVHANAGLRLGKGPSEDEIAAAIGRVLDDPTIAEGARRLQRLFLEEIEADRGVAEMEALASVSRRSDPPLAE